MKSYLLFLYIAFMFIITGCYNAQDNANVRIKLGNVPVASTEFKKTFIDRILTFFASEAYAQAAPGTVSRIYIVAYNGDSAILVKSIDATHTTTDSFIEVSIPAGDNVGILVVGENSSSAAEYFGYTTTDLAAGETKDVSINVYNQSTQQPDSLTWYDKIGMDITYGDPENIVFWKKLGIPVKYHLYEVVWNPTTLQDDNIKLYEGYGDHGIDPDGGYHYLLYIEFEPLGIMSEVFDLNAG